MLVAGCAILVAAAALAPGAAAATFCVTPATGCGVPEPTVQAALTAAASNPGADTVTLGAATYSEDNLQYSGAGPLELDGAGRTATVLRRATPADGTSTLLSTGSGAVTVAHLGVRITGGAGPTGIRLTTANGHRVQDVAVDASGLPTGPNGISLGSSGTVSDATVSLPSNGDCLTLGGPGAVIDVQDVQATGCSASFDVASGTARLQRVQAREAGVGVEAQRGSTVTVDDALIASSTGASLVGLRATSSTGATVLNARHVTIVGPAAGPAGKGIEAIDAATGTVDVNVRDSILRNLTTTVDREAPGTATVNVTTDYTDLDARPAQRVDTGGGAYTPGVNDVNVDPAFVSTTDFHVLVSSPVADLDPAPLAAGEPATDLDGRPRIINGRRDLGAYEATLIPGASTGPAVGVTTAGATLTGSINPNGSPTTVSFHYGPTTAYETGQTPMQSIPAGAQPVELGAALGGLSPWTTYHYRIEATNAVASRFGADRTFTTVATAPPAPPPPGSAPSVSSFSVSPARFAVGPKPTALSARRRAKPAPRGTTFRYRLSAAASVKIGIDRILGGRLSGRRCVPERRSLKRRARCVRYVTAGTLTRRALAGSNRTSFSGRLGRRGLAPGRYRATITVVGAAPARSRFTTFAVVRR